LSIVGRLWEALTLSVGMFWDVAWSLVLGFTISGIVQTLVSNERMRDLLGGDGPKEIGIATLFGAASSSCSYASAAVTRTIFAKGASFTASVAFLFSSTNLVIELGIVLWVLMGPQFAAAEWGGGLVLVVLATLLIRATYPARLIEEARANAQRVQSGMDHDMAASGGTWRERLRDPAFPLVVARHVAMDWSMLRGDLAIGFLIAGFLAVFVPNGVWNMLFLSGAPEGLRTVVGAVVGPLIAVVTFVCSIGNVPMAAVLWGGGISFGGVLAFLYGDLIVLPLLDVYRKHYGRKAAIYLASVLYATMVAAAIIMDLVFRALHLVPSSRRDAVQMLAHFSFDYTFWLNAVFGALALRFVVLNRRAPTEHAHRCCGDDE